MKTTHVLSAMFLGGLACLAAGSVTAQVQATPNYSIYSTSAPPQNFTELGVSVAADGNLFVVGAPQVDTSAADTGQVFVYNATNGALLYTLSEPHPLGNNLFGSSVALSGSRLLVANGYSKTTVYVYDLSSTNPTSLLYTLSGPTPNGGYGIFLGMSGTRVLVGSPGDTISGVNYSGSVYVYDLTNATPTNPVVRLINPTPGPNTFDTFGLGCAISGTRIVVGAPGDDATGTNAGIVYIYDLTNSSPATPLLTLTNPVPLSISFGSSVAILGTRVLVGAPDDPAFPNPMPTLGGIVYVYDLAGLNPGIPTMTFTNPVPASAQEFGSSLAVAGTRVVVGAYAEAPVPTGFRVGTAYVYDLAGATPRVPVLTLTNSAPSQSDSFGYSLGLSGTRLVVGEPRFLGSPPKPGLAFGYDLAGASPAVPLFTMNPALTNYGDNFGASVALSTQLVVGAPKDGSSKAGAVYVYNPGSSTPDVATLTITNPTAGALQFFGSSVAIADTRLIVGARQESIPAVAFVGAAFLYDLAGPTPAVPLLTFTNPLPASSPQFGGAVAISGTRIVVGASGDTNYNGVAYVYDTANATPAVPMLTLTNPFTFAPGGFGTSVALEGSRVAVGTLGSASVYDLNSANPRVPLLTLTNAQNTARFGSSIAISGARMIVGAPNTAPLGPNLGAAYVFDLNSPTPAVPVFTLTNPAPISGDAFGVSVVISGNAVLIGADQSQASIGSRGGGRAFLYDLSRPTPTVPIAILSKPLPASGDGFGAAVALAGTNAVVGAPFDDTITTDKGAAYVLWLVNPLIKVEQPEGTDVPQGGARSFGIIQAGSSSNLTFTIKSVGVSTLGGLAISKDGPNASDFTVTATPASSVLAGSSTTFTVQFLPLTSGLKTATIHIANNDIEKNPFDITLTGRALSTADDTDGDGLNDWAEFQLSALGFDWQVSQPGLVQTLFSGANNAGLYSQTQLEALRFTQLLSRDPATGQFKVTIGAEKADDLIHFMPFPLSAPQTTVDAQGRVQFIFSTPDNVTFIRLQSF